MPITQSAADAATEAAPSCSKKNTNSLSHLEKHVKKRLQARRRQQNHRARLGHDLETLRRECSDLAAHLAQLTIQTNQQDFDAPLCWKDIALALHDEAVKALETRKTLRAADDQLKARTRALHRWLHSMEKFDCGTAPTWRDATLLALPECRMTGLQWITERLYHNTMRMLQMFRFPATGSCHEFDVEPCDDDARGSLQYVWKYQNVITQPWTALRDVLRSNLLRYRSCVLWFRDTDEHRAYEPLHEDAAEGVFYGQVRAGTSDDPTFYYACREFPNDTGGGCTFVGRHIHEDEAMPVNTQQRSHMYWLVLEALGPTETRLRYLYIKSQQFTKDGPVTLDEEARAMGCDLTHAPTPHTKQATYTAHVRRTITRCSAQGVLHFDCPAF